jgi:ribose-phosphate pyrophosphokinase
VPRCCARRWRRRAAGRCTWLSPTSIAAPASVTGDLFVGDVAGRTALIIDDLISTGGTLLRAARAARKAGARRVMALVTHGLFMPGAEEVLSDPAIERLAITDTVPPFRLTPATASWKKLEVLPTAPLLAEVIERLHDGRPLTDLVVF